MSVVAVGNAHDARPVWRMAVASFLPVDERDRAMAGWIARIPVALILSVQVVASLRLRNTAFEDEALYVGAGHAYIDHWFNGTPLPMNYGTFFSGAPWAYPVLAGALDSVGGLVAVRVFSLLCMIVVTLCIRSVARNLWGPRAGELAAAGFVCIGPVMFVGAFATFDAVTLACLAGALWLGVTRRSYGSAVAAGLLLAFAVVCKYTGAVFVPAVLGVVLLTALQRRTRPLVSAGTAVAVLALVYSSFGESLRAGITFTTSGRQALTPAPASELLRYVLLDVGALLALALVGAAVLCRSVRSVLLTLTLLGGAALLPVAQLRLGEAVSFEKHLAYSALFLSILAGRGLLALSRGRVQVLFVGPIICFLLVTGLSRSHAMYQWPNVSKVVEILGSYPAAGRYLATSAGPIEYYTRRAGEPMQWDTHYGLFDSGEAMMRRAVQQRTYQAIVLHTGAAGNATETDRTRKFLKIVQESRDYQLVGGPFPTRPYSDDMWLIYRLRR